MRKTFKRKIQRCWPASIQRRERFLPPAAYSTRGGKRSARTILARARSRVVRLAEVQHNLGHSVWSACVGNVCLPACAPELLFMLVNADGLAARPETDEWAITLHRLYDVELTQMQQAIAALGAEIGVTQEMTHAFLTPADAEAAISRAIERLPAE